MPALRHIQAQREAGVVAGKGPFVVCMAPTRELAQQICKVLEDAGTPCGLKAACIFGGMPKRVQAAALRGGVEMVVGTPGRMVDLMTDGTLNLTVRPARETKRRVALPKPPRRRSALVHVDRLQPLVVGGCGGLHQPASASHCRHSTIQTCSGGKRD